MDGRIVMRKGYTVYNDEIKENDNAIDVCNFTGINGVANFSFNLELGTIKTSDSIGMWKIKNIK